MQKNTVFLVTGVLIIILLVALLMLFQAKTPQEYPGINEAGAIPVPVDESNPGQWKDVPLRDVSTSRLFTVRELEGKPVLLFTFTTWCSICTAQQNEIRKLQAENPGAFTVVGIDIDPYENEDLVQKHQSDNRFSGLYAVAPPELTNGLTNEFGLGMISPASAPVLLICANGSVIRLGSGVKPAGVLDQVISTRC